MKRRGMLILSLACGVLCACSVAWYTQMVAAQAATQRDEALRQFGGEQIEVCVAKRDILAGETLDGQNTEMKPWIVELAPTRAITDQAILEGKHAQGPIVAGEVLTEARLEDPTKRVQVPADRQAVTVNVDVAQAVGGALSAGEQVMVYALGQSGSASVLTKANVLATGQQSSVKTWVTLAVEPSRVAEVISASQTSSLYLTLPSEGESS